MHEDLKLIAPLLALNPNAVTYIAQKNQSTLFIQHYKAHENPLLSQRLSISGTETSTPAVRVSLTIMHLWTCDFTVSIAAREDGPTPLLKRH